MPQSEKINSYDIIVGIPSYMEADSIGYVVKQIDKGLSRYFSNMNSLIVNVDNNSEDGTKDVFKSVHTVTQKQYLTTRKGIRGKGNNFLNLFRFAKKFESSLKVIIVIDADLRSITPEWIKYLAEPILKGEDYALPLYSRHQFDGTITNHICHPLLYGLMGENIRQPIGGEFAFNVNLMNYWLEQEWLPTTRLYGIDIFMTLNAIIGKFKICQVGLGKKVHKASAPKLGAMFTQVVTTFFDKILSKKADWLGTPEMLTMPKKLYGLKRLAPPQELEIDVRHLKEQLRQEFLSRQRLLKIYLSDYLYENIKRMIDQDHYEFNTLMWTQAVYQLLYSYDIGSIKQKKDIIEAIKPIYFARSVTFDYLTWKYRIDYAEQLINDQAKAFASQKHYFYGLYLQRAYQD